jgi:CheY-like chemotaxis protein
VNTTPAHGQLSTTVLVCEDEASLRVLIDFMLTEDGYRVLLASCPEEALDLAATHSGPIDVVVTDVELPRMSGPELVERLHTLRPALEVLFISGYPADMFPDRPPLPDGSEFLQKPFAEVALLETIRSLVKPHQH